MSDSSLTSDSSGESDDEILQELNDNLLNLKPYDFEPLASSDESDIEADDEQMNEDEDEYDQRTGKTNWCLCGCCEIMNHERECLCCQEANEISDDLFQGNGFPLHLDKIHFFSENIYFFI